jgi:CubicO group peptidase (beta-lactamase class C family)
MTAMRTAMWCVPVGGLMLAMSVSLAAAAPDEELLGKSAGYPVGTRASWFYEERVRVGSFSHVDTLYLHNRLKRAPSPLPLPVAAPELTLSYRLDDRTLDLQDFLDRQRVTGLLIIKDGQILLERYQYDRLPAHRLVSHSMAKSIVCLAIGLALAEGRIASLDDKVSKYVPELAGYPYGETSIRNILRMASGVRFSEVYDGKDDVARLARVRAVKGAVEALRTFTARDAEEGARFHYASSETVVLALVVRAVTGMTLSDYLTERLWQPMGAEADATWVVDAKGLEGASGSFNAVLRDYGRLGVVLANDGVVGGKQVLPKDFLLEATDWHKQPPAFAPGRATPYFGYGYQFWTFPGASRRFALLGVYGQSIFVDPGLKLVMVITGVAKTANVGKQPFARERAAVWAALVRKYGAW